MNAENSQKVEDDLMELVVYAQTREYEKEVNALTKKLATTLERLKDFPERERKLRNQISELKKQISLLEEELRQIDESRYESTNERDRLYDEISAVWRNPHPNEDSRYVPVLLGIGQCGAYEKIRELLPPKELHKYLYELNMRMLMYIRYLPPEQIDALVRILVMAEKLDFTRIGSTTTVPKVIEFLKTHRWPRVNDLIEWAFKTTDNTYLPFPHGKNFGPASSAKEYLELEAKAMAEQEERASKKKKEIRKPDIPN